MFWDLVGFRGFGFEGQGCCWIVGGGGLTPISWTTGWQEHGQLN